MIEIRLVEINRPGKDREMYAGRSKPDRASHSSGGIPVSRHKSRPRRDRRGPWTIFEPIDQDGHYFRGVTRFVPTSYGVHGRSPASRKTSAASGKTSATASTDHPQPATTR